LTVKSVASFYIENKSRVFGAFLDTRKAYDSTNYYKILSLLLLRGIPSSVVSLLLSWYEQTQIRVLFNKGLSKPFGICHGVRQGGLLSPALFAILIDDLLTTLECTGVGCRIGSRYFGCIAYADDLVLLAPTIGSLNHLLATAQNWAKLNHLLFNPEKSQVICFSDKKNKWTGISLIPAHFNGRTIPTVTEVLHLGHIISHNLDDSAELMRIGKAFNRQFHAFFNRFFLVRNVDLLLSLFKSFCTSLYGIEALFQCNTSSSAAKFFRKSTNLALMKLLNLPRESVSPYLIAYGIMNGNTMWLLRSLTFWSSLMCSEFPHREFILSRNICNIVRMLLPIRCLPSSLVGYSRNSMEDVCVQFWMLSKQLL
jgi:hypothetical protein